MQTVFCVDQNVGGKLENLYIDIEDLLNILKCVGKKNQKSLIVDFIRRIFLDV